MKDVSQDGQKRRKKQNQQNANTWTTDKHRSKQEIKELSRYVVGAVESWDEVGLNEDSGDLSDFITRFLQYPYKYK